LDTKEFLRNQQETKILEGYNLINRAKLWYQIMQTSWSHGHAKTPIPGKPSKSGLRVGCVTMWSRGLHLLVSELGSINQVLSFWNFCFLLFPQKIPLCPISSSPWFYSILKKIVILFGYCPKYISSIKKRKKNRSKRRLLVSAAEN
jgi:hypothetical protein